MNSQKEWIIIEMFIQTIAIEAAEKFRISSKIVIDSSNLAIHVVDHFEFLHIT